MSRDVRHVGSIEYPLHASGLADVLRCPWRVVGKYLATDDEDTGDEAAEAPETVDFSPPAYVPQLTCIQLPDAIAKEQKARRKNPVPKLRRERRPR